MNPIIRNILAVLTGIVIGSIVNMLLLGINGTIIALPAGADLTTNSGIRESIKLFSLQHFIAPFVAHAGGTLVGAFLAAMIAVSYKIRFAMLIGVFFLIGGILSIIMIGGPLWYNIIDLLFAYIPMGFWGYKLAEKFYKK